MVLSKRPVALINALANVTWISLCHGATDNASIAQFGASEIVKSKSKPMANWADFSEALPDSGEVPEPEPEIKWADIPSHFRSHKVDNWGEVTQALQEQELSEFDVDIFEIDDLTKFYTFDEKKLLGVGGVAATVFRGQSKQQGDKAFYAIKKKLAIGENTKQNLFRELGYSTLFREASDSIIQTKYIFKKAAFYYIVMELCNGGDLFDKVSKDGAMSEDVAKQYVKQILGAVKAIHSKGVVHGDLKLENIVCHNESDDEITVKVIDFEFSDHETVFYKKLTSGVAVGTPGYMAPELVWNGWMTTPEKRMFEGKQRQILKGVSEKDSFLARNNLRTITQLKSRDASPKTFGKPLDVWAIGVMTFMLVQAAPPFESSKDSALKGFGRGPERFYKPVPTGTCRDFIFRCLQLFPEDRMTIEQLELHPWLQEQPKDDELSSDYSE